MLVSRVPASKAMPLSDRRLNTYWWTIASGALAAKRAMTSGLASPFLVGRSMKSGGALGLGDHAAAPASCALVPKSALAISSLFAIASAGDGLPPPGVAND